MHTLERERLFREVFSGNKEKIFRLCLGFLKDREEVMDLFQEIMVRIWDNLPTFRNEAMISTWVYRITINTALLYRKRQTRDRGLFKSIDLDLFAGDTSRAQDEQTDRRMNLERLRNIIAGLNKQDRLIITLFLEGLSYKEISDIIGISPNYVGVKINRVKTELSQLMGDLS